MRVKLHYVGLVRDFTKKSDDEFNLPKGASLLDLLSTLAGTYGKPFQKEIFEPGLKDVKANFVVTVNGALMGQLGGIETCLNDNDNVVLMSLMTGG
jgi:molybdopterin converting factor small subunit